MRRRRESTAKWTQTKPTAPPKRKTFLQEILLRLMKMETTLTEKAGREIQSTPASFAAKDSSGIPT